MKLSTRSRYGARILLELARNREKGPKQVAEISQQQKIPVKYLEQLIRTLKSAGLVKSVRGPKGGHLLAREPGDVYLGEIVRLFEGKPVLVDCVQSATACDMAEGCRLRAAWTKATEALYSTLDSITIADLLG